MNFLQELLGASEFIPHGHCYLWSPALVWTQVGANLLIGLAYIAIAVTLASLMRRLQEVPFRWMYYAFAVFIFACGVTHFSDVLVVWLPYYWADATVRVVTAAASVTTALLLPPLVPKAIEVVRGVRSAAQKGIRLESAVEDLESMYRKAKELEEKKTQFFANVSHELRTPLTLILGESRSLLDSDLDAEEREAVQSIVDNSRVLLKHVEDLLGIASFEAGELELDLTHFDLADRIRRVAGSFDGLADEYDIDFRRQLPESLPVRADAHKLESVVLNLLSNAFKFTPDEGTVVCSVSIETDGATEGAESVELTVRDSGPGVPEQQRDAIFERFQQMDETTAERFGGTGLGLVLVRDYAELHGGSVEVGDAPEGGASFVVRLPIGAPDRQRENQEAPASRPSRPEAASGSLDEETAMESPEGDDRRESEADLAAGDVATSRRSPTPGTLPPVDRVDGAFELDEELREPREAALETLETDGSELDRFKLRPPRILVVEDNVEMNDHICRILPDHYQTLSVYDGKQALDKLRRHEIDTIVTDLMMPKLDGVELVERISRFDEVPMLVVTAKVDDRARRELLRKGADDFLPKPFAAEELRLRVSHLVAVKRTRDILERKLASQREDLQTMAGRLARRNEELQEALETARIARDHAERASEMKTEFLGLISHELRTPLTALKMQFHLLREQPDASAEKRREILDRTSRVLDRLLNMIEDLLDKAALESGQLEVTPEACDLREVAEEIVEENRPHAANAGLDLELEVADDLETLETDPRMLRIILVNLVRNAIKFTEEGRVSVSIEQRDGESILRVEDTGPGIDVEDATEMFEAFRRSEESSDSQVPGVGLGLSVVRDMTRALGGFIQVDSEPGRGTTFGVTIPTSHRADANSNPI